MSHYTIRSFNRVSYLLQMPTSLNRLSMVVDDITNNYEACDSELRVRADRAAAIFRRYLYDADAVPSLVEIAEVASVALAAAAAMSVAYDNQRKGA